MSGLFALVAFVEQAATAAIVKINIVDMSFEVVIVLLLTTHFLHRTKVALT